MKSILVIIPYFGKLPATFPFWYNSALENRDVDFLFITDLDVKEASNIRVLNIGFEEMGRRISDSIDTEICLRHPYKLCDFKPTYGYVFADEVKGYDFWGFGDIDLVYGRIRDFFTDDVLSRYDVISGWGHLTLYRNCGFCNTFFMRRNEGFLYYKDCFDKPGYIGFDEYPLNGCSAAWNAVFPEKLYHCESFMDDVRIQSACAHFRSEFSPFRHCLTFIYENGNLYRIYYDSKYRRHKEPTLYAHFQKRYNWAIDVDDYSRYIIYPDVFRKPFRHFLYTRLMFLGSSKTARLK